MHILFSPIHYVLDGKHSGSEFSWSYHIFSLISKAQGIQPFFITGGTRALPSDLRKMVHNMNLFNPASLDLRISHVLKFYLKVFLATRQHVATNKVDILHHVLPFRIDFSFNLYALLSRKKFVIGPVQQSLTVQDSDLSVADVRGFKKSHISPLEYAQKILLFFAEPLLILLSFFTLKRASRIIVVNNQTKLFLAQRGVNTNKIVVIPPGIDAHRFQSSLRPSKKFITCMTSTYLLKRKNIDVLIQAVAIAHRNDSRIRLHIIGDGPQKESLQALVQELGAQKYIFFKGFVGQKEIVHEYAKTDIYLNASSSESFAASALEALASGLPIVASRVGGYDTVVQNGRNGYIVAKPTAQAFAKKINYIASQPKLRTSMRHASRSLARAKYDWETVIIPQYLHIYEEITK